MVAGEDLNIVEPHFPRYVCRYFMPLQAGVNDLNDKGGVGESLKY